MALISRHPGAPYIAGEELLGADLEQDIATIFGEINGNLTDVNLSSGAAISGDKIATGTIGTEQLANAAVTAAKIAAEAVTGAKIAALTVTAGQLAANAVSKIESTSTATSFVTSTSYQTLATISLTTAADAGPVLLFFQFRRNAGEDTVLYRVRRDSTNLVNDITAYPLGAALASAEVETDVVLVDASATDATTHSYTLAARQASGSCTVTHIFSYALELRR